VIVHRIGEPRLTSPIRGERQGAERW